MRMSDWSSDVCSSDLFVPTTDKYDGQKLFTREGAKRLATPLFTVLILIEATDVVFAVDSVPAILAVSREPFIVFASNAFAILGLRSLYFVLGGMQRSEEHTSELQSLMRISYAVFCLKKKN